MKQCVVTAVLATACGSKGDPVQQVLEKHEAELKTRLAQLHVVLDAAKKRPPLAPPKLTPPADPDTQIFVGLEETTVLDSSDMDGQPGCRAMYGDGAVFEWLAGRAVRGLPTTADEAEKNIRSALERPYAAVCVQLAVEKPETTGSNQFTGGTWKGECRFFEIATGAYVGGVAASSSMLSAAGYHGATNVLGEGMEESIKTELRRALEPTAKGVKPPFIGCHW